jgi:hypothetical protein
MSTKDEISVAKIIEEKLNVKFNNTKFKLNGWGEVDNWCKIGNQNFLFLEVETKQNHPNTNVVKLWPYLEEYPKIKIFLIQCFFSYSPGNKSNRGKLGIWTANKLSEIYRNRFEYKKIVIDENLDNDFFDILKNNLNKFIFRQ